MLKWLEKFENAINWAVLFMMAVVVLLLTVAFAVDLVRDVVVIAHGSITSDQVFEIFGDLLLILIGLELMHTVKIYFQDHTVHVEVILTVALVALARKAIVVNLKEYPSMAVIGLALMIISIAASYWFLSRRAEPAR